MYEGVNFVEGNKYLNPAIYIAITLILGIASFGLGYLRTINIIV
jgi:fluoride ion exporter CrcB/FEX